MEKEEMVCVLANFGNSRAQIVEAKTRGTFSVGQSYYVSPENLPAFLSNSQIKPGKKSDVYALGVVLVEMCVG